MEYNNWVSKRFYKLLNGGKNVFRKILCAAFILIMLSSVCLAETASHSFVMAGFDGENSTRDWNTNDFFTRMEQRTGISFTFQQYNSSKNWQAAKNAMFSEGGQLPDVLFKANLSTDELIRYTDSGQLIDLAPLLEEYAPNFWAILNEHPEWKAAITLPNGKIGALPSVQMGAGQNILWINKAWLETLKLDLPTDFASLKTVLTAFRDKDPNKNGKADEIPLSFIGPWDLKFFSHAYGVVANDYNLYLDDNGQVRYWADEDSFFELAKTLHELYEDKLLDQSGFYNVDYFRRITDDKNDVPYGMFFAPSPMSLLTYNQSADYIALPPFAYEGKQVYRNLFGGIGRGAFAITSACSDPSAMLSWVDWLYTEEGAIEAMLGKLNVNYTVDEEGYWNWKGAMGDEITNYELQNITVYDTGNMPWMFPMDFYNRYEDKGVRRISEETANYDVYLKRPFPYYTLTLEESARIQPLQNQLGRYVDEAFASFILGEMELNDDTIAAFRQGLRDYGLEEMLKLWQPVADRAYQE